MMLIFDRSALLCAAHPTAGLFFFRRHRPGGRTSEGGWSRWGVFSEFAFRPPSPCHRNWM